MATKKLNKKEMASMRGGYDCIVNGKYLGTYTGAGDGTNCQYTRDGQTYIAGGKPYQQK